MLSTKIVLLALTVAGAGALGAGVWANGRGHGFGGRHGFGRDSAMVHKFVEFLVEEKLTEIGATEAQKQKVREVEQRLVSQGHALHADQAAFREELLEQLAQDEPDAARVKALVRERVDAFARFTDDATGALLELHQALTPAQRQKLLADARAHLEAHHAR